MEEVTLRPWAKINLYLEVSGRYDNGYHGIRTLIQPISLFDELVIRKSACGGRFNLTCLAGDLPVNTSLPKQSENLISKAVDLFFSKIGEEPSVDLILTKNIPICGGLGGGSSDAATALLGLNKLYGNMLKNDILKQIAEQIGMDTSCFLEDKPVFCSGRGEIIEKRFCNRSKYWCVLVNPGEGLSTSRVYSEYSLSLTDRVSIDKILPALSIDYNIGDILGYTRNDLETPAIGLLPVMGKIKKSLETAGAEKSFVCGSGSTVCGLAHTQAAAEQVAHELIKSRENKDWWIKVVSFL